MKSAWAYIRVSTQEQGEFSPDAQLREIKQKAKGQGHSIVQVFQDIGESAKMADRPEFQRMINEAKRLEKGSVDAIYVHKIDRFARNREDSVVYKAMLRREYGIQVLSAKEDLDDGPVGRLIEGILECIAEWYSLNLAQEVRKGMTEKAMKGGNLTRPAFGYVLPEAGERFEIVPEQAEIVQLIYKLYTEDNWGRRKIAKYLNENIKIRQPERVAKKGKKKGQRIGGNPWNDTRIKYILNNPLYIGKTRWNVHDSTSGYEKKPEEDWIISDGQHEPIINIDVWEKAQMKTKRKKVSPGESSNYLLSGLLRCADCGSSLSANRKREIRQDTEFFFPYYNCDKYKNGSGCRSQFVSVRRIESAILAHIKKTSETIENISVEVLKDNSNEVAELTLLERSLESYKERYLRIKHAFESGVDTLEEYKENKLRLKHEEEEIENRIKQLKTIKPTCDSTDFRMQLKNVHTLLNDPTVSMNEKKQAIRKYIKSIEFSRHNNILRINYCIRD
ncbi:site-specific recombinase, DNA invertase Pin [Desulfosporosinus acidiphilus SJ4]|uniref:Site-specific recombinase, DNA invertase Pin n=1 Tax=Desulfosporosinus acidiphilus (strain DSM 22704 / JCM 16185 / SJ4) TaxID=646529 RepID=I4DB33_DESAJ|nr:recombinase family protein [Desulfosporosinus acidiphilus]AFM43007.1 site-specific recombinase, DNA invertase Pin [Desulfosporosinus acidiphilus SJ4]